VADVQILRSAVSGVPMNYTLPDTAELRLKAVYAEFDDNGAGSDWLPTVTILSDSGHEIARACEQEVKVTAGADADVSWFPRIRRRGGGATPSGTSCQLLGSGNGDTTLALTLTSPVPATGTLHVVYGQASIPDGVDGGSEPTAVADSGGLGPWRRAFAPNSAPIIGQSRQTDPGNAASIQVGSVGRACVAADLGIGSTITVTFGSVAPANFHSTGLIIYQPAYFVAIPQFGLIRYAMGDAHPDFGASTTRLSWDDDYGAGFSQADQDAAMITAMAAYPPVAGFAPFYGTVTGEIASGSLSLASACVPVCEASWKDPGGTWPAGASLLTGCYQFAQPRTCSSP
jgi:hypothetical protein